MRGERPFHTQLKDITRSYGDAWARYAQGMARGDVEQADAALADMQEIEQRVTIIERPVRT